MIAHGALDLAATSSGKSGGGVGFLVILVPVALLFLFMSRQNKRRQAAARQVTNELTAGAEVVTVSGLYATVTSVADDTVDLEVAPGVVSKYAKRAIAEVLPPPSFADPEVPSADLSPQD